jgi:hypothetical protein
MAGIYRQLGVPDGESSRKLSVTDGTGHATGEVYVAHQSDNISAVADGPRPSRTPTQLPPRRGLQYYRHRK